MNIVSASKTADGMIEVTTVSGKTYVHDDMNNPYRQELAEWEAKGNTITPTPVDLYAYLSNKRKYVETGGITFNGVVIATDRESQAMITGAYNFSQMDPGRTFNWKTTSGFITLDASALTAIATAVGNHVQACFDLHKSLMSQIDAGTLTTTAEIDNAAWTSTY